MVHALRWASALTAAFAAISIGCGGAVVGDDDGIGDDDDGPSGDDPDRPERPDGGAGVSCGEIAPGAVALGGPNGGSTAYWPSITVDGELGPVLTYSENGNEYGLRWDGAAWQPLGQQIEAVPGSVWQGPSAVTSHDDRTVVAWAEATPSGPRPYAAEWNGEIWAMLGGVVGTSDAYEVAVALDMTGAPIVAWSGSDDDNLTVRAARWNGSSWQPFGSVQDANPNDGQFDASPALAVGADGAIYLAWHEPTGLSTSHIRVRTWSGSDWALVGTGVLDGVSGMTDALVPYLVVDAAGRLVVGWSEEAPSTLGVFVSRWNGGAWEPLGVSLSAAAGSTSALVGGIAVDRQDHPIVAWVEPTGGGDNRMHVYRHDGATFAAISPSGGLGQDSIGDPAVTVDECDRVFAAWSGYDGVNQQVFVNQLFAP